MMVGLSREKIAYLETLNYLEQCYPGFSVDFVFNPGNFLLKDPLDLRKAEYETEQQKMVLITPVFDVDTTGVELLSDRYAEQYCDIHDKNMYWTGEKVMEAQDCFRTFLTICNSKVVGYMAVTYTFKENEPFDLLAFLEEEQVDIAVLMFGERRKRFPMMLSCRRAFKAIL